MHMIWYVLFAYLFAALRFVVNKQVLFVVSFYFIALCYTVLDYDAQDSSKGGAVETGCSDLFDVANYFTI